MRSASACWLIGNYDGVHRGHQALISCARERAEGADVNLLTFHPHPRTFFDPNTPPFCLTPWPERESLLRAAGVSRIVVTSFDAAFSSLSPDDFVRDVLETFCKGGRIVVGDGFRFGAQRRGTVETLKALLGDKRLHALPPVCDASGKVYASSRVRTALQRGDVAEATHVLGRAWNVSACVEPGDPANRVMGFPTANLPLGERIRPHPGVYLITAEGLGPGLAHLNSRIQGQNQGGQDRQAPDVLEVHLLEDPGDLYGQSVTVRFLRFLHPERARGDMRAFRRQITQDLQVARDWQKARESAMQEA